MFGLDRLRTFGREIVDATERLLAEWDDGQEVVLGDAFSRLALSILTNSLFDFELGERREVVTTAAAELQELADFEGTGAVDLLLPSWITTPGQRRYERAMDAFDETVRELVERRRRNPDRHDDLLTTMLETEDDHEYAMSDAEVHDHLVTFLVAGHETTATVLTFTWLLLSTHPDERARLDEEVAALDGPPSTDDLDELPVTERVVKEAMRLYPPAFMQFREAVTDTTLGGYDIPEGTKVLLPQYTVHRDDRWWDAPDQFRPGRFRDDRAADRPDFAYFPFGGGPHQCIGMHFAMMELKHVVPMIARAVDFELLSSPDPDIDSELTLQPANDVRVRVHR
jgi:cytochrome P450